MRNGTFHRVASTGLLSNGQRTERLLLHANGGWANSRRASGPSHSTFNWRVTMRAVCPVPSPDSPAIFPPLAVPLILTGQCVIGRQFTRDRRMDGRCTCTRPLISLDYDAALSLAAPCFRCPCTGLRSLAGMYYLSGWLGHSSARFALLASSDYRAVPRIRSHDREPSSNSLLIQASHAVERFVVKLVRCIYSSNR